VDGVAYRERIGAVGREQGDWKAHIASQKVPHKVWVRSFEIEWVERLVLLLEGDQARSGVTDRDILAAELLIDLQRLPAAFGIEEFNVEVGRFEESFLFGELQERTVPEAALRNGDLELVGRLGWILCHTQRGRNQGQNAQNARQHGLLLELIPWREIAARAVGITIGIVRHPTVRQ